MKVFGKSLAAALFVIAILSLSGCNRSGTNDQSQFNAEEWRNRMKKPSLTAADFTQLYAQLVRANLKDAQVEVTAELEITVTGPDGGAWKVHLGNLWAEAANDPSSRADICQSHLKSIIAMVQRQPGVTGAAETNSVVPTIKDDLFFREIPAGTSDPGLVTERFVADLNIVYASDREGMMAFLKESDRKRFNLELPALRSLAIANLKRILHRPIQQRNNGPVFMLTTDDGYTASILLLDDFWNARTNSVKGEIVATVPARDVLLFTSGDSSDGLAQLKQLAQKIYADGDHVISTTLLRRHNGHWEKFTD